MYVCLRYICVHVLAFVVFRFYLVLMTPDFYFTLYVWDCEKLQSGILFSLIFQTIPEYLVSRYMGILFSCEKCLQIRNFVFLNSSDYTATLTCSCRDFVSLVRVA